MLTLLPDSEDGVCLLVFHDLAVTLKVLGHLDLSIRHGVPLERI